MAALIAQSKYIFGLRKDVTNNLCFMDDQTVVFPSGNNCVRYNIDQKWQKFIPGTEKSQGMQAMAISANRRYLAVSESGVRPTVTVYDLTNEQGRRKKVLSAGDLPVGDLPAGDLPVGDLPVGDLPVGDLPAGDLPVGDLPVGDLPVGDFQSLAFSADSKYLVGLSGPAGTLVLWLWKKEKVVATCSTGEGDAVTQVSFNPLDNTQVCVMGPGLLRLYGYEKGALSPQTSAKVEGRALLSHAWLSDKLLVAGTATGHLLTIVSGTLRWEMDAVAAPIQPQETRHTDSRQPAEAKAEDSAATSGAPGITAIVPYSKGFICSVGPGSVCVFESVEGVDSYRKSKQILIPPDPCCLDPGQAQQQEVNTLCLSPGEETLALSTQQGQLYAINLVSAEISRQGEQAYFEFLSSSFHSKPITGLSVCIRKPLVASCSLDRSVRVWNYETNVLELYKEFPTEALSVSLHPSGLFLLVGFTDKLMMMNLLIDDICLFKEFPVRSCPECVFSHGGHLFAAVNGNVIQIYSVTTLQKILTLRGHNGKVQSVVWSADDGRLVSCGTDGAVYEWNAHSGKRQSESVLKSCVYTGVAISSDAKAIFAAGTSLKQIQNSQVVREMSGDEATFTALAMARSGKLIFTGTSSGTLRVIRNPLPLQRDWTEYQAHSGPVTKVLVTFDGQLLLTASEDGSLLVWRIKDKEGRGLRAQEVCYSDEILITKSDLELKIQSMQELKTRVDELKMEKEYQLRLSDLSHQQKTRELSEAFNRELESLQAENQIMKEEGERRAVAHPEDLANIIEMYTKELQEMDSSHSQRLLNEYDKYNELQQQNKAQQEEHERRLQAAEEASARALEELRLSSQEQLQDKSRQLEECQKEDRNQTLEQQFLVSTMEKEANWDIVRLTHQHEKRLVQEEQRYQSLEEKAGITSKQLINAKKEVRERCQNIERLEKEKAGLQGVIALLNSDILGLKKEIKSREKVILTKEKAIFGQHSKNKDLEKISFIHLKMLEMQKKKMAPNEEAIQSMKEQIREMEVELEGINQKNTRLELHISDLEMKLRATAKEKDKEIHKGKQWEAAVHRFQVSLHRCAGLLQEPRQLKEAVREMHSSFIKPSDVVEKAVGDEDVQREQARQRDHLEKTLSSLKLRGTKDSALQRQNYSLMRDNTTLIQEINSLRQELMKLRAQLHSHQVQSAAASGTLAQRRAGGRSAESSCRVVRLDPEEEVERIIQQQRYQIQQLRLQVQEPAFRLPSIFPALPTATGRLPVLAI